MGCSQEVKAPGFDPGIPGSNPGTPAIYIVGSIRNTEKKVSGDE